MADQDDFMFDEEEEEAVDSVQESEDWGDYETEKKGGSKRLLYLLLLLLVLLGGAAYMFLLAPDEGPSPPIKVVTAPRKPIAAPMPQKAPVAKPAPAPMQEKAATTPEQSAGEKTATPAASETSSGATPTPPRLVATQKTPPAPVVAEKAPPAPAAVEKAAAPEPKPTPAEVQPKLFDPKPAPAPVVGGDYTLSAGAFAMQSSVDGVTKKIRKLGYEPQVTEIKRKVEMTRLLVGVYSPDVAKQKLREVKKVSSGAFSLNKGSKTAVYAGSFLVLDKARVFSDTTLSKNGIRVTEEPIKVDRPLQRVTFGSFATRDDAAAASRKVAGKGLEAKPVKK